MRRLLLVFLSILLPLQFAWAGAAAYCAHEDIAETTSLAWHFGHHTHQHKADQAKQADGSDKGDHRAKAGKLAKLPDADCTACHFPGSHGLFAALRLPTDYHFVTLRYQASHHAFGSIPAPVPDRPQWSRLA